MTTEQAYSILKLQTLSSLSLQVIEDTNWNGVKIYQSPFRNACKTIVRETERASDILYGGTRQLTLQGLNESDELMYTINRIVDATLNFKDIEESKAVEALRRIKSILFDYKIDERDGDYIALYTLSEAKEILNKK